MRLRRYQARHLAPKPNPLKGPIAAGAAGAVLFAGPASAGIHRVRPGETLSGIGAKYGVSVAKLVKANNLSNPNLIVAGKKLRIPGKSGGGGGSAAIHVVRSGETLSGIASRYGMTLKGIARRNKIANVSVIRIGQRLKVRSGGGSSNSRAPASTPSRATVGGMIHRHAVGHGVNPALAKAVAWQESGWRQNVVSSAGAIGVMQVMPGTADYVNKSLGHGNLNVRRADDNIHLGVAYLAHMLRIMPNERKALAAYYSGPGNVGRKLNRIQRPYVRSVRALKRRF